MGQRKSILIGAVVTCGALTLSLWAAAATIDQFPAKAREALQKLAGDNPIIEVESEKEGGVQLYEAAWKAGGVTHEAEVTADGVLVEMEEGVRSEDVPEAVRTAAEQALAGAPKIHYEKHTYVVYEVEGKVNGKNKEVVISPTGKLQGGEDEEDEDGDDDDDDAK